MVPNLIHVLFLLPFSIHASAYYVGRQSIVQTLWQFPPGGNVENLCELPGGSLAVTLTSEPTLYYVDTKNPGTEPKAIKYLPSHSCLLGITLLNPFTLAVVAGNVTNFVGVPDSFYIYLLTLSGKEIRRYHIPNAVLLNGITTLPHDPVHLLLAGSTLGVVWRLNLFTGRVDQAISDPCLHPGDPSGPFPLPGVNGLDAHGNYLYFTNSNQNFLGRFPITWDGRATGHHEVLTHPFNHGVYDDIHVTDDETLYVTQVTGDTINRVWLNSNTNEWDQKVVVGLPGDPPVSWPTGVILTSDLKTMYIVTSSPKGGQILKVDMRERNNVWAEVVNYMSYIFGGPAQKTISSL